MTEQKEPKTAAEKIHDAYVALCKTKPYYKIKVSDVVAKAGINRTTFYKHYAGMPDLILSMYRRYMKLLMQVPAGMTIRTADDLQRYAESVWTRLTERREELARILHQPGVLRLILMYGRAFQRKLTQFAKKAKLTDPAIYRNITYAPYLFTVRLFIFLEGEPVFLPQLTRQQQHFDFSLSIPENLSRFVKSQIGGNADFHYALFGAYIKLSTGRDEEKITVTELLDTAGISRTQFYLYYKNMEEFREKFYYTVFELVIEFMLSLCRRREVPTEAQASSLRETIYAAYNQKAVLRALSTGKLIEYVSYLAANLFVRYSEQVEAEHHTTLTEEQKAPLIYYIGVHCAASLQYYVHRISFARYCEEIVQAREFIYRALENPNPKSAENP